MVEIALDYEDKGLERLRSGGGRIVDCVYVDQPSASAAFRRVRDAVAKLEQHYGGDQMPEVAYVEHVLHDGGVLLCAAINKGQGSIKDIVTSAIEVAFGVPQELRF